MLKTVDKQSIRATFRKRYQSPTGHPNQIIDAIQSHTLPIVSQSPNCILKSTNYKKIHSLVSN